MAKGVYPSPQYVPPDETGLNTDVFGDTSLIHQAPHNGNIAYDGDLANDAYTGSNNYTGLHYGKCYRLSDDDLWLGGDSSPWNYYVFGRRSNVQSFQLCKKTTTCQRQNTNDQEVREGGKFYLWDFRSNHYSKTGNFATCNNLGNFYAAGLNSQNYAYFEAYTDDCSNPGSSYSCYLTLSLVGQQSGNNGLQVQNNVLRNDYSGSTVTLRFQEVKCPDL
ncbi:hypothetical protein BBP40_008190 [Aspergillus hancockii]|nr:hypothetical protein BBP40_008190 [Aspergillus hancockii]